MGSIKQDNDETRESIGKRLAQADGFWSKQYDQVRDDLEFASGKQWDKDVRAVREDQDGRPTLTLNHTRTYIDRIVNALRVAPIGIQVDTENDEVTEMLQGKIRDIEHKSEAKEAYETAYESAVTSGVGYIVVGTEYVNDETLDQTVVINTLINPTHAFLDPLHKSSTGADAEWGGYVEYLDKQVAEEQHGDEIGGSFGSSALWQGWEIPEFTVPDMVFYERKTYKTTRTWLQDGSYTDEKLNDEQLVYAVQQREIEQKKVCVYRFVGEKMVEYTELPISYIPIVPVYGDRLYLDNEGIYFGGMVHRTRDLNKMQNYLASSEMELAGLSPKAPFLISEGQLEGYENMWDEANTSPQPYLVYKPETIGEKLVGEPHRLDNNPQVSALQAMRASYMQDYARTTGMFDQMFGQADNSGNSGRAILLRQTDGELSTAQYLDNLAKSIAQVGKIVIQLMKYVYDTDLEQPIRSEDGTMTMEQVNISAILEEVGNAINITTHAGPSYESRRRESLAAMLEIGRIAPAKFENMLDLMVDNLNAPGSREISTRLKKMLPPELQEQEENAPDPQAMQALQAAEQTVQQQQETIDYLEGIVRQLQSVIIDDQADRQQKMAEAELKAETDVMTTQMDNATKVEVETIKAQAKLEDRMVQMESQFAQKMAEMQTKAEEMFAQTVQSGMQPVEDIEMLEAMKQQAPVVAGAVDVGGGEYEDMDSEFVETMEQLEQ